MHGHEERHESHRSKTEGVSVEAHPSVFPHAGDHRLRFRITDSGGGIIQTFDEIHDRRMHFIIVREDLAYFMHLHPTLHGEGWWEAVINFREPGPYTAFADFSTAGSSVTLPLALHVQGHYEPRPLEQPTEIVHVNGYDVGLMRSAGEATFTISTLGERVTLTPYLGAMGHLVVLRADDLAFLHAHPLESREEGLVRFRLELPRGYSYKAFLQFVSSDTVHTAAFVVHP
jgi:hypothetical protein